MSDDPLMTVEQLAATTTLAPSTFYRWAASKPPCGPRSFKLGGRRVYRRSDVEAWLATQEQATQTVAS